MIQSMVYTLYRYILFNRIKPLGFNSLKGKTIVFAPHQDDETLACGGTIYLNKQVGTCVKIVFMTDGSNSHSGMISRDELRDIRASEAVAAARDLGVEKKDLIFLGYEDGKLNDNRDGAVNRVGDILEREEPKSIFIPSLNEPPIGHWVTAEIVLSALRKLAFLTSVYEYPVWLWYQWPWIRVNRDRDRWLTSWKRKIKSAPGFNPIFQFRYGVNIKDILNVKMSALQNYSSQMVRYQANPAWEILPDVGDGTFLNCFFSDYELFRRNR